MKRLTATTPPEEFIGGYGIEWKRGLLSEHVDLFVTAGGTVRAAASGSGLQWALAGGKAAAVPVVCSEVISILTEDGYIPARCGIPAVRLGACEDHAYDIETYAAQSEAERAYDERQRDGGY
jgi:hypothetical protein